MHTYVHMLSILRRYRRFSVALSLLIFFLAYFPLFRIHLSLLCPLLSLSLSYSFTHTHMKTHRQTHHTGLAGPLFGRKIVTATRLEFRSQNGTPRAHRQRTNLPRPPACGKFTPPIDVTRTASPHSCLPPATRCTWWFVCTCASAL